MQEKRNLIGNLFYKSQGNSYENIDRAFLCWKKRHSFSNIALISAQVLHSQVPLTISKLLENTYTNGLEDIFAVDAYIDTGLTTKDKFSGLTVPQQLAGQRNCAHTLIRRTALEIFQRG